MSAYFTKKLAVTDKQVMEQLAQTLRKKRRRRNETMPKTKDQQHRRRSAKRPHH
jgi:hypothetical protein